MDEVYEAQRASLIAAYKGAQAAQVDAIAAAVADAAGDATKLAQLSAPPVDASLVEAHLQGAAREGVASALQERDDQIGAIAPEAPAPDQKAIDAYVAERAQAVVLTLAQGLSSAAAKRATAVSTLAPAEAADDVRAYLSGLSDAELELQLGGSVMQAYNVGRREFIRAQEIGNPIAAEAQTSLALADVLVTVYASEVLDKNTCEPCASIDGTEWHSIAEAQAGGYPLGGYMFCYGGLRCRGTLVATYTEPGGRLPKEPPPKAASPTDEALETAGIPPKPKPVQRSADVVPENVDEWKKLEDAVDQLAAARRPNREAFVDLLEETEERVSGGRNAFVEDDLEAFESQAAKLQAAAGEPRAVVPPLKTRASTLQKLERKQVTPESLTDINRASILAENLDDMKVAFNAFRELAEERGWRLYDLENGYLGDASAKGGYRDMSVLVRSPAGDELMEVQFHVNQMWAAKFGPKGHGIYDQLKVLAARKKAAKDAGKAVDPADEAQEAALTAEMEEVYNGAFAAMQPEKYIPRWEQRVFPDVEVEGKLPKLFADESTRAFEQMNALFRWPQPRQSAQRDGLKTILRTFEPEDPRDASRARIRHREGIVELNESMLGARFQSRRGGFEDAMSPPIARTATVHEFGHRLDLRFGQQITGERGSFYLSREYTTGQQAAIDDVLPEWRALWDELRTGPWWTELATQVGDGRIPRAFAQYLSSPWELFARAFQQYVARKSFDDEVKAELARKVEDEVGAWTEEDFDRIEVALDALFDKLGVLR